MTKQFSLNHDNLVGGVRRFRGKERNFEPPKLVQPPLIRYNLADRGRKYRGTERNFDIPKIVAAINSNECQERVKTRGMLGYFGHWVRIRFGLEPSEGGIVQGKAQAIEPALVTTYLKAFPNGDIEHQTEFLDNDNGYIASRMYQNKVGGFSSAILEENPTFYGFDWVNDPNYSTNRGYSIATLDSVHGDELSMPDILMAEMQDQMQAMNQLLALTEARSQVALDCADILRVENDQLLEIITDLNEVNDSRWNENNKSNLMRQIELDKEAFDSVHDLKIDKPVKTREQIKEEQDYQYLKSRITKHV